MEVKLKSNHLPHKVYSHLRSYSGGGGISMGSLVQIRCILGSTIVRAGEGWLRLSGSFGGSSIRSRLELGKPMLLGGEG